MQKKSEFLEVALEASQAAAEIILHYYQDRVRARLKADQSPVTVADEEAERAIIRCIKKKFPQHDFLGEESGLSQSLNKKSEFIWIIDPIDGTKNYIRKIPFFGIQIALMKKDELIIGVSMAPVINDLVYAEKGQGVFRNGIPVEVSHVQEVSEAMLCFGGLKYFLKTGRFDAVRQLIKDVYRDRGFGDFYHYHFLASGQADIVIEGQIRIWDIAAATVAVREAGGQVTDLNGQAITLESTHVLATNSLLHSKILPYFK